MARLARIVVPGVPHHVTQRGNRRETVFFQNDDYAPYLDLLTAAAAAADCAVWSYCLMPNHVHMILVPAHVDGLRGTLADAHRRYTRHINRRSGWTGHLWQGRFGSVAMDEAHLIHAARYVALNPVRARLVRRAQDWAWSSARAHLAARDDGVVTVAPLLARVPDFAGLLAGDEDEQAVSALRKSETIGRPLGTADWLEALEAQTGRRLRARKRGRQSAGKLKK